MALKTRIVNEATQPGVVVDDVEDLHLGAAGQSHVGDVHLPALVGQLGAEAHVGALRALVRLGGDEPVGLEHPPDRRRRRGRPAPVAAGQVHADRLGSSVDAHVDQFLADPQDLVLEAIPHPRRRPLGPS
jgi:hypothetical protein